MSSGRLYSWVPASGSGWWPCRPIGQWDQGALQPFTVFFLVLQQASPSSNPPPTKLL